MIIENKSDYLLSHRLIEYKNRARCVNTTLLGSHWLGEGLIIVVNNIHVAQI
jgi:hypothetical protein